MRTIIENLHKAAYDKYVNRTETVYSIETQAMIAARIVRKLYKKGYISNTASLGLTMSNASGDVLTFDRNRIKLAIHNSATIDITKIFKSKKKYGTAIVREFFVNENGFIDIIEFFTGLMNGYVEILKKKVKQALETTTEFRCVLGNDAKITCVGSKCLLEYTDKFLTRVNKSISNMSILSSIEEHGIKSITIA